MVKLRNLICEVIKLQDITFGYSKKDNVDIVNKLLNKAGTISIKGDLYSIAKNMQAKMIQKKDRLLLIVKKGIYHVFYIQVLGFSKANLTYYDDEKFDVMFDSTKQLLSYYKVNNLSDLYKKIQTQKNLKGYNPPYLICKNLLDNLKYQFYLSKNGLWSWTISGNPPIHLYSLSKVHPIIKYQKGN